MPLTQLPTVGDLGPYYDRWLALNQLIIETQAVYGPLPPAGQPPDFERQQTILNLLECLRLFGEGQFNFFYYGFDPNANPPMALARPRLKVWDEFPPEDVLTGILEQIGNDLELIQRAASQRKLGSVNAKATLRNADRLARCALQPAIDQNIINEPATVLTHFQKSAEFYSIPYANVAIIAIPFTSTAASTYQDYLAIPHEVGHYVYRNPTDQVREDLKNLRLNPPVEPDYHDWFRLVFEEMCADIYGCLVGGPVMARDFIDLCVANSQKHLSYGDDRHPNPAIRPLIYCEVLKNPVTQALADSEPFAWQNVARLLAQDWNLELYGRHVSEFFVKTQSLADNGQLTQTIGRDIAVALPQDSQRPAAVDQTSLSVVVPKIITALLSRLAIFVEYNRPLANLNKLKGWAGRLAANVPPDQLLPLFEDNFDTLLASCGAVAEADPPNPRLWLDWAEKNNDTYKLAGPNKPIPAGSVEDPDLMRPNSWGSILFADGWTTGGPSDNSSGHPAT